MNDTPDTETSSCDYLMINGFSFPIFCRFNNSFSFVHSSLHLGTLHQDEKEGLMLILFDKIQPDATYQLALGVLHAMGEVVDMLYLSAKKLRTGGTAGATGAASAATATAAS